MRVCVVVTSTVEVLVVAACRFSGAGCSSAMFAALLKDAGAALEKASMAKPERMDHFMVTRLCL